MVSPSLSFVSGSGVDRKQGQRVAGGSRMLVGPRGGGRSTRCLWGAAAGMVLPPRLSLLLLSLLLAVLAPLGIAELTDGNSEHLKREHSLIKPYQGAWSRQGALASVNRHLFPLLKPRPG